MDESSLRIALRQAEADLAFALAQGDGYAEDDADRRIREIKDAIAAQEAEDAGAL